MSALGSIHSNVLYSQSNIENSKSRLTCNLSQVEKGSLCVVNGLELNQDPEVFSPQYFASTAWFAQQIPYPVKGHFLEIGTGVGAIALTAALKYQNTVVATDINSKAVKVAQENVVKYEAQNQVECRVGSLFDPIDSAETFEMIFWNWPFIYAPGDYEFQNELERAIIDPGYEQITLFLKQAKDHLKEKGKVVLTFSSLGNRACFDEIIYSLGYTQRELSSLSTESRKYELIELSI